MLFYLSKGTSETLAPDDDPFDDWEHSYGLNIINLDNPGWAVTIDLEETPFDNSVFEKSIDKGLADYPTVIVIG